MNIFISREICVGLKLFRQMSLDLYNSNKKQSESKSYFLCLSSSVIPILFFFYYTMSKFMLTAR